jgi:predicted RNase H-like HicB family nuclease
MYKMEGSTLKNEFGSKYPNIAEWVEDGTIEIGQNHSGAFVSVYDEGGTIWEGKHKYMTMDEALQEAEEAIGKWLKENM